MTEVMASFVAAKEWARKYQHLYPDNELFPAIIGEKEMQPEFEVFAKLDAYARMLAAKTKRLSGQPLDQ